MKYEITYPEAELMQSYDEGDYWQFMNQYRKSVERGTIARDLAVDIRRELWLEQGGQTSVDQVIALLTRISNVSGYQRAVLDSALQQIGKHGGIHSSGFQQWEVIPARVKCSRHTDTWLTNSGVCGECMLDQETKERFMP